MVRSIIRKVAKASRKSEFTWRYASNLRATLGHRLHRRELAERDREVLENLNRDGIAITSVSDLLGDCPLYDEMLSAVAALEVEQQELLAAERLRADDTAKQLERKPYVRYLLGDTPQLDSDSVFVRFALQKQILRITNAYFGMLTRLAYFNVWHTYTTNAEPQSSQLWHRDFDDPQYIMKVFVYLSDVDQGSGPLSYAIGSHQKGKMLREPDCVSESRASRRSSDEQMAEVIPADRWLSATGKKGTIAFVDTHGYHKGGWARKNERILYTCMFTSPTVQLGLGHEQFVRPAGFRLPDDPEAAAVLTPR